MDSQAALGESIQPAGGGGGDRPSWRFPWEIDLATTGSRVPTKWVEGGSDGYAGGGGDVSPID